MIRSIEKSSDPIGNRTHNLQTCSIGPQPTTLPRALSPYVFYVTADSRIWDCQLFGAPELWKLATYRGIRNWTCRCELDHVLQDLEDLQIQ
jgi:hypothetical protein